MILETSYLIEGNVIEGLPTVIPNHVTAIDLGDTITITNKNNSISTNIPVYFYSTVYLFITTEQKTRVIFNNSFDYKKFLEAIH